MNMSVCSETFLFQNLLWRVCVWRLLRLTPVLASYLSQVAASIFFPFLIFFDAVRLHLVEEEWASHYSWMCFAQVKSPDAIWKMPRVHDKLSVTLIIHRCRRLSLKNDCLCSVGSQCHRPPSHIFACVQNCICKHDNIFNTLYINED